MSSELVRDLDKGQCLNFCWYADAVGAPVGYSCADEQGCRKLLYEEFIDESRKRQAELRQDLAILETGDLDELARVRKARDSRRWYQKAWAWLTETS